MRTENSVYRKNFSLIIAFLVLISVTFIIALFISYNLTSKYVENEFASKKSDVLEQTTKPYADFFYNRIPEITFYQGFLDSASAAHYSSRTFRDYPFVTRIVFYDVAISSPGNGPVPQKGLDISLKSVDEFVLKNGRVVSSRKA